MRGNDASCQPPVATVSCCIQLPLRAALLQPCRNWLRLPRARPLVRGFVSRRIRSFVRESCGRNFCKSCMAQVPVLPPFLDLARPCSAGRALLQGSHSLDSVWLAATDTSWQEPSGAAYIGTAARHERASVLGGESPLRINQRKWLRRKIAGTIPPTGDALAPTKPHVRKLYLR